MVNKIIGFKYINKNIRSIITMKGAKDSLVEVNVKGAFVRSDSIFRYFKLLSLSL